MDEMLKDARFAHIARDPKFRRIPKAERKVKIDHRFKGMFKDEKFTLKYTIDKRGRPINRTTTEDLRKYYDLSSSEDEDVSVPSTSKKGSEKKVKATKKKEKDKKSAKEIESKIDSVKDSSDKKNENEKSEDDSLSCRKESLSEIKTEECSDETESSNESSEGEDESGSKEFSQVELNENENQLHKRSKGETSKLTNEIKKKLKDLTVNYARGEGVLMTDSSSEEELSEANGKVFVISYIHPEDK